VDSHGVGPLFACASRTMSLGMMVVAETAWRELEERHGLQQQLDLPWLSHEAAASSRARLMSLLTDLFQDMLAGDVTRHHPALLTSTLQWLAMAGDVVAHACGGVDAAAAPFPTPPPAAARRLPRALVECFRLPRLLNSHPSSHLPHPAVALEPHVHEHPAELPAILSTTVALLASSTTHLPAVHVRMALVEGLCHLFLPPRLHLDKVAGITDSGASGELADFDASGGGFFAAAAAHLAHPSPVVATHLAPALLAVYCSLSAHPIVTDVIECRHQLAALVKHLLTLPAQRRVIVALAQAARGTPPDLQFLSFCNDIIAHTTTTLTTCVNELTAARRADAARAAGQSINVALALEAAVAGAAAVRSLADSLDLLLALAQCEDAAIAQAMVLPELAARLASVVMKALTAVGE